MRELSLFSGAGGGLLATRWLLGWRCVGYVESDRGAQAILAARVRDGLLDDAPLFADVRAFLSDGHAERYRGVVDVVTGGFPCQPHSQAGRRRGHADERNLWPETLAVLCAVRPRYALLENVAGLLTSPGPDGGSYFGRILADLAEAGFDAEWCVLGADDVGAPHRRKRVWILAHAAGLQLQRESCSRDDIARPGGAPGVASVQVGCMVGDAERAQRRAQRNAESYGDAAARSRPRSADVGDAAASGRARSQGGGEREGDPATIRAGARVANPDESRSQGRSLCGCGRADEWTTRSSRGTLADSDCGASDRLHERVEAGYVAPDSRGNGAGGEADPPRWPPGPDDADGWRRILEHWPELASATTQSAVRGVADGLAGSMDLSRSAQLRAISNGMVPDVVALAWRLLSRDIGR